MFSLASMEALTISTMVTNHLLPNPSYSSKSRQKYLLLFSSEEYYEQGPSIPEQEQQIIFAKHSNLVILCPTAVAIV